MNLRNRGVNFQSSRAARLERHSRHLAELVLTPPWSHRTLNPPQCKTGRMLGHGEAIRVKRGERVLFHVLNGSATEIRSLERSESNLMLCKQGLQNCGHQKLSQKRGL